MTLDRTDLIEANGSSMLSTQIACAAANVSPAEYFPIKELTLVVQDLQKPRPAIFWTDLVCCVLIILIGMYLSAPFPDQFVTHPVQAFAGFVAASFALFRASYFNHELAHQSHQLSGFALVWNLVIGGPLLCPSSLYSDHRNHHSNEAFATKRDAEYLPEHLRNAWGALAVLALAFVLPFIYIARFGVLVPVGWVIPAVRHWVDMRASSLGLLGLSRRAAPIGTELKALRRQELGCCCYALTVAALLLTGIVPVHLAFHIYFIVVCML